MAERLANGAVILTSPAFGEVSLLVATSPEDEPIGLEGASRVLVDLALEGAGGRDEPSPRARALRLGAELDAYHDGAMLGWRVAVAPRGPDEQTYAIDAAVDLLLDLALEPALPATTLTSRAEHARERLRTSPTTAREAARRWAAALALGHGRPVGTTPTDTTLVAVNREALVRLHRRLLRPDRLVVLSPAPLAPAQVSRLAALTAPSTAAPARCGPPPGHHFALASPRAATAFRARPVPGLTAPGRVALEAALARADLLGDPDGLEVTLVDLGHDAALVHRDDDVAFEAWRARTEASLAAVPSTRAHTDPMARARAALYPPSAEGPLPSPLADLDRGVVVELGNPSPGARELPLDGARCRPGP